MAVGDQHFPDTGASLVNDPITSSASIDDDGACYYVDTSEGAVTLTVGATTTAFTVYDSHFNFGMNNCTVDFGGGNTKVMDLDGEIMTFFKDSTDAWRYISVGVGSGGEV